MAALPRSLRILVVEDYADTRDMYVEYLSLQGHDVVGAEDGVQALAIAQAVQPELIVLDINLPRLDGLSVLRRMRADPLLDRIPVVTLSAATGRDYEDEAMEAGAVMALHKPLLPDELHHAVLEAFSRGDVRDTRRLRWGGR